MVLGDFIAGVKASTEALREQKRALQDVEAQQQRSEEAMFKRFERRILDEVKRHTKTKTVRRQQ